MVFGEPSFRVSPSGERSYNHASTRPFGALGSSCESGGERATDVRLRLPVAHSGVASQKKIVSFPFSLLVLVVTW